MILVILAPVGDTFGDCPTFFHALLFQADHLPLFAILVVTIYYSDR
nr:hypothetical protein 142p_00144 [Serratia proteamaculans]